jgi:hypothetical protein
MEPFTTTALIASVVTYLAKKVKDNQSVQDFFSDFTTATVNWIKPLFIKEDGTPEKIIKDLQEKPDSAARQDAIKSTLAVAVEDNPEAESLLREMIKVIQQKEPGMVKTNTITVTGDGNKTYQDVSGSTINDHSITQKHSGTGNNVGGNKITNQK